MGAVTFVAAGINYYPSNPAFNLERCFGLCLAEHFLEEEDITVFLV